MINLYTSAYVMNPIIDSLVIIPLHLFPIAFCIPKILEEQPDYDIYSIIVVSFLGVSLILNIFGIWIDNLPYQTIVLLSTLCSFCVDLGLTIAPLLLEPDETTWLSWIQIPGIFTISCCFALVSIRVKLLVIEQDKRHQINMTLKRVTWINHIKALLHIILFPFLVALACYHKLSDLQPLSIPLAVITGIAMFVNIIALIVSDLFYHIFLMCFTIPLISFIVALAVLIFKHFMSGATYRLYFVILCVSTLSQVLTVVVELYLLKDVCRWRIVDGVNNHGSMLFVVK